MSIALCENCDVLLNIFSYLPQRDVMEEARYVGKRWLETALVNAILVDPLIENENQWRYRTLQSAIDHCKDGSVIIIDNAQIQPIHISNKTIILTSRNADRKLEWRVPDSECCLFELQHATLYLSDLSVHCSVNPDRDQECFLFSGSDSTFYVKNCQFITETTPSLSFLSSQSGQVTLYETRLSGFAHCVHVTGNCVIQHSRFIDSSKECVTVHEGTLAVTDCEIKCGRDALAGILYDNPKHRATLTKVTIQGSRIGVLLQGDCRLEDCCIERCKQVGMQIDNKEEPLSIVMKKCVVNRCLEGIRGRAVDLVVVESTVKYCEIGILVTDSSFFQCLKSQINSCAVLAIVCKSVLSVQVSENRIYDCHKGIKLDDVHFFRMESNCIAYVQNSVLLFHQTIKGFSARENYICLSYASSQLIDSEPYIDEDCRVEDNTIFSREEVTDILFGNGLNSVYNGVIVIPPVEREKGISFNDFLSRFNPYKSILKGWIVPLSITILGVFSLSYLHSRKY